MLILVRLLQRITDFVEEDKVTSHLVVELDLLNCKEFEEEGKRIDKENYSKDCFGIEFNYVHFTNELCILDEGVFYINNNGDKTFLKVNNLLLGNIKRCVLFEYNKFLKDKENYLKNNNVTEYDIM